MDCIDGSILLCKNAEKNLTICTCMTVTKNILAPSYKVRIATSTTRIAASLPCRSIFLASPIEGYSSGIVAASVCIKIGGKENTAKVRYFVISIK